MRRIFVSLCALALAVPVFAQEVMPAGSQTSTPTAVTSSSTTSSTTSTKSGLFSRMFRGRNNNNSQITTVSTTAPSSTTMTTTTMEPVYNSRGRITGYRAVDTHAPAVKPAVMPMPTPAASPVTQASGSMSDSNIVQSNYFEPATEPAPKRGLFSRIGLKK